MPTNFEPGAHGTIKRGPRYNVRLTNVGEKVASGPTVLADTLPAGLTPGAPAELPENCSVAGQLVTCTIPEPIFPGEAFELSFAVDVAALPDPTVLEPNEVTVTAAGATPATTTTTTTVTDEEAPFGFDSAENGLGAWLTEADGSAATAAGSHPSQFTVNVGFKTRRGNFSGATIIPSGAGVRDVFTDLPPGFVIDPNATPVRCTEEQFETGTCPDASVIGRANVTINIGDTVISRDALYNLEPPSG